jgi:hypothetical protein
MKWQHGHGLNSGSMVKILDLFDARGLRTESADGRLRRSPCDNGFRFDNEDDVGPFSTLSTPQ